MRFLTLSGSGIDSMSGSLLIGFAVSGSMSRLGEIGVGIPSVCPASMLQASNGTLLIATGLGPMYRMRYNEINLSRAGVPSPTEPINLLTSEDYVDETSPIIDPLTGRGLKLIEFDFTGLGNVYQNWVGSSPVTQAQGMQSMNARMAVYQQNVSNIAAIIPSELATAPYTGSNLYARERVIRQLTGTHVVDANGTTIPPPIVQANLPSSTVWNNLSGSFCVYDTDDEDEAIDGRYQCFQRWVDADGYVSDPGPLSNVATIDARNLVKYESVQVPTDSRIAKRQIWRNDSGQLQNFYLDIETDDLTSTSFSSTNTDAQLQLKDVITFTDVDGYTIPYLYAEPPDDKPFLAEMRGRIFAVGSRRYSFGSSQVTNGSTTVRGVGTSWTTSMSGRRFIAGRLEYLIIAVDESAQELTLNVTYAGPTDNFATYTIAPYAAQELIIRWSDPTAGPEAWPLTAQLLLPQDGDTITGLVNYGDALYITKTRNIYRFSFSEDPAVDGQISPAAKRGCVNHRCAVSVEGACYMLDREGIHAFTGGPNPQHITIPVADLFREGTDGYRINWNADLCFWHAILHQEISTIKWYVTLAGDMYPQHAICYDYRRSRFWLEEYPRPIASSCYSLAITGRPLLGTTEGKVLAADSGTLDLIETGGTLLTIATVNSPFSVTLSETPKDCEGVPMVVVTGAAAGVDRIVTYQDGAEIQFGTPLEILPSKGDKLQLGGVKYHIKTAAFDSERMDGQQSISLSIKVQPNPDAELYGQLSVYKDGGNTKANTVAARSTWGAASKYPKASSKHTQMLMADANALIVETLDTQGETDTPINFEWQFAIDGSSGDAAPKILEMKVEGGG
jgi:hypothetical protein